MLCYILSLALAAPSSPPIWCLCNAPTSSSLVFFHKKVKWKTISHVPISLVSWPSNRGVKFPIVLSQKKNVRHLEKLCQVLERAVFVLHSGGEKFPRKAPAQWNKTTGTMGLFWHLWSPFSPKATQTPPTQKTHPKNSPTNHWRQATWHHSNHVLLASVHAPRCASLSQWSWHLNPPEGQNTKPRQKRPRGRGFGRWVGSVVGWAAGRTKRASEKTRETGRRSGKKRSVFLYRKIPLLNVAGSLNLTNPASKYTKVTRFFQIHAPVPQRIHYFWKFPQISCQAT